MTDANALADELEAKLAVCEREGLTFKAGWNLIRATITALRTADKHQQALAERDALLDEAAQIIGQIELDQRYPPAPDSMERRIERARDWVARSNNSTTQEKNND